MLHSEIQGQHTPNNGEGITLQDLYELLRRIPRRARENYITCAGQDVVGIAFGQSDQAEKWEFNARLMVTEADIDSSALREAELRGMRRMQEAAAQLAYEWKLNELPRRIRTIDVETFAKEE